MIYTNHENAFYSLNFVSNSFFLHDNYKTSIIAFYLTLYIYLHVCWIFLYVHFKIVLLIWGAFGMCTGTDGLERIFVGSLNQFIKVATLICVPRQTDKISSNISFSSITSPNLSSQARELMCLSLVYLIHLYMWTYPFTSNFFAHFLSELFRQFFFLHFQLPFFPLSLVDWIRQKFSEWGNISFFC
jgi:hypothetical protein